MIRMTGL